MLAEEFAGPEPQHASASGGGGVSFAVNGRFFAVKPTGVQRVAREYVRGLDALIADQPAADRARMRILLPEGASCDVPVRAAEIVHVPGPRGQLWEQTALPRAARGDILVNLANTGPIWGPRQILMIHDAQVYDAPHSYSRAFRTWYRIMQPMAARRAHAVTTVSQFSSDRLAAHKVSPAPARVIHNGVDHIDRTETLADAAKRLQLLPHRYVFAMASDQPHKNLDILVRAFSDPRLARFDLALAGGGNQARAHAARLENIRYVGFVSDAELKGLYAQAGAFAFPSRTEGFGLPPLEAMWCGAPVLASPGGAIPEACGDAALYADPDDVEAWIEGLLALLTNPREAEARRAAGRARAQGFTWQRASAALFSLIAEASARRRAG